MLRKLVIIGSIAALFVLTAAPAFGLSVNTGQGAKEVLDVGSFGDSNPAHGPACGSEFFIGINAIDCGDQGVSSDDSTGATDEPIVSPVNEGVIWNVGAWNAVFGPGGILNENSAICGVGTTAGTFDPNNTCVLP
jgi:hypothetical protein